MLFQSQSMGNVLAPYTPVYQCIPIVRQSSSIVQVSSILQDITYIFTQTSPSSTWTIIHNLGQFPSITLVDTSGNVILAQVQYTSNNQIIVSFSQPIAGSAYLNV